MIDILIMVLLFLSWFSIKRSCDKISHRLDCLEEKQGNIMSGVFKLRDDAKVMAAELIRTDGVEEKQGTYYRSDPRFDKDDGQTGFHDGLDD